jgi:hypothetical protein
MPTITLSEKDLAEFTGAFEFSLMQSGITRDELAAACDVHRSQFSKVQSEPNLLKIFLFAHKLGELAASKRLRNSAR